MSVHLNARLKTRYIPLLFSVALLITLGAAISRAAHASADGPGGGAPVPAEPFVSELEIREVMSEGVDPSRVERRPGFSTTITLVTGDESETPALPSGAAPAPEDSPTYR